MKIINDKGKEEEIRSSYTNEERIFLKEHLAEYFNCIMHFKSYFRIDRSHPVDELNNLAYIEGLKRVFTAIFNEFTFILTEGEDKPPEQFYDSDSNFKYELLVDNYEIKELSSIHRKIFFILGLHTCKFFKCYSPTHFQGRLTTIFDLSVDNGICKGVFYMIEVGKIKKEVENASSSPK